MASTLGRWTAALAAGGWLAALAPSVAAGEGTGCGSGTVYARERIEFSHVVDFTLPTSDTDGYLVDCLKGADAYMQFIAQNGASYAYYVWGQIGSYT